jgi:hypothetical protein
MKEREEEEQRYREYYSPVCSAAKKRTISQMKPKFEDILKDLSSSDSVVEVDNTNGDSTINTQVERVTGSSIDLTGDSIIVIIDTEEGESNEDSDNNESTSTGTSGITSTTSTSTDAQEG